MKQYPAWIYKEPDVHVSNLWFGISKIVVMDTEYSRPFAIRLVFFSTLMKINQTIERLKNDMVNTKKWEFDEYTHRV